MIKGLLKAAAGIALAGSIITGNIALAVNLAADVAEDETPQGVYSVDIDGSTLKVDTKTLNLSITRGDRTWYSGKRFSEEDGLNSLWVNKLTDGVTVGYKSMNTGTTRERTISMLKPKITFKERTDGFDAKISCRDILVSFTLQVRLSGNKLQVKVPFDSISEDAPEDNKLEYLIVYPFFDSSYALTDGEILIPDGSGALIDLSVPTSAQKAYSARVYGSDYGISFDTITSNSPQTASMPVYAMMYDDGGTMVTADDGAEYCSVNAYVSGITTNYNFAYFNWIYRESYVKYYESSGTDGKSYVAFQEDMNKFDLVQTMTLLEGDCDTATVAKEYRKTVDFKQNALSSDRAGLRLQFLMAENKKGMFGNEVVTMTKTSFIEDVAEEAAQYCGNLSVSVLGYTSGGLNNSYPKHFPLDGGPGGKSGYKKLSQTLKENGVNFSFTTDYAKAYAGAGVNEKKLALNISNQFTTLTDSRAGSTAKFNLINPDDAAALMKGDLKNINKYNASVDYASVGSLLYSGYKNRDYDRAYTAEKFREAIELSQVTANIIKPNAYMWAVCDSYLEMPVSSSGFMIETESVPFLQMVVSGKMQTYSTAINLNYTGEDLILRLIDYNVYPSFLVTQKDALELYGTNSAGIFTSSYDIWKDTIKSIYTQVDGVLSAVAGCTVEDRYTAGNGVYVTVYSNGKKVVVNYGGAEVTVDGTAIAAKSAAAID